MRVQAELEPPNSIDSKHLHRMVLVEQICLSAAGILALIHLFPRVFATVRTMTPAGFIDAHLALAALCSVLALFLLECRKAVWARWVARCFSTLSILIAASYLSGIGREVLSRYIGPDVSSDRGHSTGFLMVMFLLAGVATLFVNVCQPVLKKLANWIVVCLSFFVLTLVLSFLLSIAKISESPLDSTVSLPGLICLVMVNVVLAFRLAEDGVLSILLGNGKGSHLARILVPLFFLIPFLRELLRAHLLHSGIIPAKYSVALLTALSTSLAVGLILFLARVINRMQEEFQILTLRDELTGLHSLRSFHLVAEQAYRSAKRARIPFTVLFVDMDNLKIINDQMGHGAGSVALIETARLLTRHLREADVIGRVGGDEFVVAGQFSKEQATTAVKRVRNAADQINLVAQNRFSISVSVGFATTEDFTKPLKELISEADAEMYLEKRLKKEKRGTISLATG